MAVVEIYQSCLNSFLRDHNEIVKTPGFSRDSLTQLEALKEKIENLYHTIMMRETANVNVPATDRKIEGDLKALRQTIDTYTSFARARSPRHAFY